MGSDPFLFSVPALWDKRDKFHKLTRDPARELTDLEANLAWYRERYDAALASDAGGDGTGGAFAEFRKRFREYITRARDKTDDRLARYARLAAAA
jgi:hypothetical protein